MPSTPIGHLPRASDWPDLFPLFASRQSGHGGSNISGVQSLVLDAKLGAARRPGTLTERTAAYADLQKFLSAAEHEQHEQQAPSGTELDRPARPRGPRANPLLHEVDMAGPEPR
jgi:hypothetical protein